jgi:NAD(P)-dependent dehydrogenase (short-subunit alcohol dehydrogenase family)
MIPSIETMENAFSVKGKNVVITGGNRGIGKGIAQAMAQCSANVAVLARDMETSQKTIDELQVYGGTYRSYQCDVTDIDSAKKAVADVVKDYGSIDVLVNNSGIGRFFNVLDEDESLKNWFDVINVNLNGYFIMSYLVAKQMRRQNYGRIINISSNASRIVNLPQRMSSYNASKAAIDRMTMCLAHEWAEYNIRVNAIAPGYTETDLTYDKDTDKIEYWMSATPVGRFGKPIEVGAMAVYLASPATEQVTGAVFTIDGGYMLAR